MAKGVATPLTTSSRGDSSRSCSRVLCDYDNGVALTSVALAKATLAIEEEEVATGATTMTGVAPTVTEEAELVVLVTVEESFAADSPDLVATGVDIMSVDAGNHHG